jgi:hypothetical protein
VCSPCFRDEQVGFFAIQAVTFGVLGAGFNHGFAKLLPFRMRSKAGKIAEIAGLVFLCNVVAVLPLCFPSTLGRCFTPPDDAWEVIKLDNTHNTPGRLPLRSAKLNRGHHQAINQA